MRQLKKENLKKADKYFLFSLLLFFTYAIFAVIAISVVSSSHHFNSELLSFQPKEVQSMVIAVLITFGISILGVVSQEYYFNKRLKKEILEEHLSKKKR